MVEGIDVDHRIRDGLPVGGFTRSTGIDIRWQDGVVEGRPNGASVETVIFAAVSRLLFFQEAVDGRFACDHNAKAIALLTQAIDALEERTREREERGVEGTYAP
jgi:hypothetical protein